METQKHQPKRKGEFDSAESEAFKGVREARQVTMASKKSEPITAHLMEEVVRRERTCRGN
jgi:hypothetical protein